MAIHRLNISVTKCLNPSCKRRPTIQLNSQKMHRDGYPIFTAEQALVCPDDETLGRATLLENNPGFNIEKRVNPSWLLHEQREQDERESQNIPPAEEGRVPLEGDALRAYIERSLGATHKNSRR